MMRDGQALKELEAYIAAQEAEKQLLQKQLENLLQQHEHDQRMLDRVLDHLQKAATEQCGRQEDDRIKVAELTTQLEEAREQLLTEREARIRAAPPPAIIIIPSDAMCGHAVQVAASPSPPRRLQGLTCDEDADEGSEITAINLLQITHNHLAWVELQEKVDRLQAEAMFHEEFLQFFVLWNRADVPSRQRDAAVTSAQECDNVPPRNQRSEDSTAQLALHHEEQVMELKHKLAEAARRIGYLECILEDYQRKTAVVGNAASRKKPGVTQMTQTPLPEKADIGTLCCLLAPKGGEERQQHPVTVDAPILAQQEIFEHELLNVQRERARLEASVDSLRTRNEQLLKERAKADDLTVQAEQRGAECASALNAKLLELSAQLATYRIRHLDDVEQNTEAPSTSVQIEKLTLSLRSEEVEKMQLRQKWVEQQGALHLLEARLCEQELKHSRSQDASLSLQHKLREKSIEVESLVLQLRRLQEQYSAHDHERMEAESCLRSQIVSLSTKLRTIQENQLISQYKAERNVVSFSAFEDLQLQLAEQQQQLHETRQLLLELVGDFCYAAELQFTPTNRPGIGIGTGMRVPASPVSEKPLGASVVELAKRALLRERSQSLSTPLAAAKPAGLM